MEQRPESGAAPLDPPSAAVAQAYLAESARVTERRERFIDRRAAARLLLVEGAMFGIYLIALMFAFLPTAGANIVVIIVPFLIWTQLANELRGEYGYQRRGSEQRLRTAVVIIVAVMAIGALATLFLEIEIPWGVRLVPGVVSFLLYALLARSEWRRATAKPIGRERAPFTRTVRITTISIGVVLGLTLASTGSTSLGAAIAMMLVMLALVVWLITVLFTGGGGVATAWGAFLWTCFGIAGAMIILLVMLLQYSNLSLTIVGYVVGALIALAFVIGALKEPERV